MLYVPIIWAKDGNSEPCWHRTPAKHNPVNLGQARAIARHYANHDIFSAVVREDQLFKVLGTQKPFPSLIQIDPNRKSKIKE